MRKQWLTKFAGTKWTGRGELWLDPEGNSADLYECELHVEIDAINYIWSYKDKIEKGSFTFNESGAIWVDSWHQPEPTKCIDAPDTWGLFTVKHDYDVPSSPSWGWQSKLSERPGDTLVLQMSNIAPWGEEGRAFRMIFTRVNP